MDPQFQDAERQAEVIPFNDLGNPNSHWIELFRRYDQDGDDRISIAELRDMIRSPGFNRQELPQSFIHNLMQSSDINNDGYLNLNEFVEMIHRPENRNIFGHLVNRYIKFMIPGIQERRHSDTTDSVFVTPAASRQTSVLEPDGPIPYECSAAFDVVDSPVDGPYEEEYKCWPPALCMVIVSIVEFILYLYDALVDHPRGTGPIATELIYNPYKRFEAWRFFSYMFVHIGSVHLVVNLFVQLLLGIPLEMVHKWYRVLVIYVAGVFAGSLFTSITDPSVFLAGASGGVYALITAHLATLFLNWKEMEFAVIQLLVYLCIIGTDVGTAIYNRYAGAGEEGNVGYVAHLGGAIAGLLVGIGVLRNLNVRPWEKKLWWCAIILYFALMSTFILMNIFWSDHFAPSRPNYK